MSRSGENERHEKRIAQAQRWCRHYTGLYQNDHCAIGIAYATLKDDSVRPYRWPCCDADAATTCASRSTLTREEAEADVAASDAGFQRVMTARRAIVAHTNKVRGVSGEMPCPNCGGRLRYSIAGCNGHIHGSCSTEDCCSWME